MTITSSSESATFRFLPLLLSAVTSAADKSDCAGQVGHHIGDMSVKTKVSSPLSVTRDFKKAVHTRKKCSYATKLWHAPFQFLVSYKYDTRVRKYRETAISKGDRLQKTTQNTGEGCGKYLCVATNSKCQWPHSAYGHRSTTQTPGYHAALSLTRTCSTFNVGQSFLDMDHIKPHPSSSSCIL